MYHFIGIKQNKLSALALMLNTLGYNVEGSDCEEYAKTDDLLNQKGIKVFPISAGNIKEDMIVIRGENIEDDNVEIVKANELGVKIYSYNQMVKRLTDMFNTIAISGCSNKSITTELMTYTLADIIGCNYLLNDGRGYADRENKYLCLEVSEDQKKFLNYNPYYSIITNIDLKYHNYYNNIDELIVAYQEFASKSEKMVLACGDDSYTHLLNVNTPIFYYGLNSDNDIMAKEVNYNELGTSFEVHVEDNYYGNFELPIYGKQMLRNVLSVIGICYYERIEAKYVSRALKEFFDNKKVFDEKQFKDIITVHCNVDHPRDVKVIIKALRQKYPEKDLKTIFNPSDLFNDPYFIDDYIESVNLSDKTYIIDDFNDTNQDKSLLSKIERKEFIDLDDSKKLSNYKNTVFLFINKEKDNSIQTKVEEIISNKNKKS